MTVLTILAAAGAVVGLWVGATRHSGTVARGYRWLGGAALFWTAGLIVEEFLAGSLSSPAGQLSLADVAPLLALATLGTGIMVLALPPASGARASNVVASKAMPSSVLPGLADGYVMAVALLVIGWVMAFGSEFRRSGELPQTFLLSLLHPLVDLAVLGALLPVLTVAWRRVLAPYLALLALTGADSLGVGARISGGHQGILEQLAMIAAACLLGVGPWVPMIAARLGLFLPEGTTMLPSWHGYDEAGSAGHLPGALSAPRGPVTSTGAATIIAAVTVVIAAFAVIINGLASAPASGLALVIAGGAAVLVVAVRVLMLVRENGVAVRMWRESSRSLRELADRTSDIVVICDLDGVISYASPAITGFSYPPAELVGKPLVDFVHPEDVTAAQAAVQRALSMPSGTGEPEASGRFSCRVRAADGSWRHVECVMLLYRLPDEPAQMLVTARDISDQVALRQQVTHLTFHDGLTGLPNRAYVEERAREALAPSENGSQRRAGVIFLDLDGFTAVNDLVGHGAGDLVIAQTARRLRAVVPAQDTVARWGGDEFAVLLENAPGAQEIAELADRLAGTIADEPFRVADREIVLTASVGVALADESLPGLVLRNADVAMARAKDGGGGRVEVYAAHMHADVVRRLELIADLQRAVAADELTLQYQPIVELATSRVVGVEALVRWWRGDELVQPDQFLAIAEESSLIIPLGEWVLRQACAQAALWRSSSGDVDVSVNLSLRQLSAPELPDRVAAVLAETGLPPQALTVEVGERVMVEDAGLAVERLAELRGLGIRLAVDDFGTGYASLAHLHQPPVDIIKIDPSFVSGLGQDATLTMLTRTIVQVGRDLDIQVVAEGIEHPRQLAELREMGCGYGQGFLLARPMGVSDIESLIRAGSGEDHSGSGLTPGVGSNGVDDGTSARITKAGAA